MTTATAPPPPPPGAAPAPVADKSFAVTSGRVNGPRRVVLYGPGGIGKSTLASLAPGAVILDVEQGTQGLDANRIEGIETFQELRQCLNSEALESCGSVVVDSLTAVEEMALQYTFETVMNERGAQVDNIEGYGFGKGYRHLYDTMLLFLQECDAQVRRGRNVILIAHECVQEAPNPNGEDWIRYEPDLQHPKSGKGSVRNRIKNWADDVLFIGYDVVTDDGKGKGAGTRTIYASELPTHLAKSRRLPATPMPFTSPEDDGVWRALFGGAQ